jgi:hypothetical protein
MVSTTGTTGVSYGPLTTTSQSLTTRVAQSTTVQMTLGSAATTATAIGMLNDFLALHSNLCSVYGTCCYSNNCNPATKTVFNPINLALTLVFSLISYVAIF